MFLDWPIDEHGPCTQDRTLGHMRRWLQQSRPFVYEVDGVVVGLMNLNLEYTEVLHAAVRPAERGKGYFNQMAESMAEHVISLGVEEITFVALDQASFIADKYHKIEEIDGVTGKLHRAKAVKNDFA